MFLNCRKKKNEYVLCKYMLFGLNDLFFSTVELIFCSDNVFGYLITNMCYITYIQTLM